MKGSPTVSWNNLSRGEWDATLRKALAAYQQDWAYGDAIAAANPGVEVWRADVARPDGVRIALAQILCRRIAGMVRLAICTLGPVWVNDPGPEQKAAAYRELRRAAPLTFPGFLLFTPDESFDSEAGLKGRKRIMTGDATILLDLSQDQAALRAGLDGKWRNALVKAEKSDLRATRGGSKPAQYRWLLEAEAGQRRDRGYRALPTALTEEWQLRRAEAKALKDGADSSSIAVYRADQGRDACGGMLFLLHGRRATYHIGWTNDVGRANAGHNLLLWTAMVDLKERGYALLDLGGVNTQSGAGIARFKIGSGGRVLRRAGSFL